MLLFGAYTGYKEGFLISLFSLIGIVLGILGGFKLLGFALIFLSEHFDINEKILPYVAFGVVFVAIVIIVSLVAKAIKASIDKTLLGRVDQAAGAALGLLKSAFMVSVALWIATSLKYEFPQNWTANSQILPLLSDFAPQVTTWIGEVIPAFNDIF
jgi:membrane protein required for colicin V production